MRVKVKTKAKTIQGKLEAIISQHLVETEDGIILYQRDVAKMILDMFDVKVKK